MAQRHMCSSMSVLRRSLVKDVAAIPKCSSRALHSSARRLDEQPSGASPPASPPNTRKARSATALKQITSLQNRRIMPGALARGSLPNGQTVRRNPREPSNQTTEDAPADAQRDASPRMARNSAGPTTTRGSTPPSGQMVRAPATLNIRRGAMGVRGRGGPNLRGRDRAGPGGARPGDRGPKKREKKQKGGGNGPRATSIADVDASTTLSDGMVHHLLRLQRKEWDRVPYEPKYAKGSFAANELIHTGRELFRGESPPVKIWGPLEKRIGVVGMFGAEARLQVRRVGDGDEEPFGQEKLEEEVVEVQGTEKKNEASVQ